MLEKKIADKIRQIRKSKGLTLAELGKKVGLSKALLSRIENNLTSPPIATLSKISQGLEMPISTFFEEEDTEGKRYCVIRKHDRKQIVSRGTKIGFTYHSLTSLKPQYAIEPFIIRYPVIKKEPKLLFEHPGEEFLFVLKGKIKFIIGKQEEMLEAGDVIHFDPSEPHRGQNFGKEDAECLVIVIGKEHLRQ